MRFHVSSLLLSLIISITHPALVRSSFPILQSSESSAESALRTVVDKYFALYAAKDLDGLMNLWSEKSPDYPTRKKDLQRQFAAEDSRADVPTVLRVKVKEDQASLRATVSLTAVDLKSHKERKQKASLNFAFVAEYGVWKIWRAVPAEDDLAETLIRAGTEAGQVALMAEEQDLVTPELVRALADRGNPLLNQGAYPKALSVFRLELGVAEKIGDRPGITHALNSIGTVHHRQGDYAQALEFQQKSLALSEAQGDRFGIARTLISIGEISTSRGDFKQAQEFFEKSLPIFEATGDQAGVAVAQAHIAGSHWERGNLAQALESFQKSLRTFEVLEDKPKIAATLCNIGLVYHRQGNYPEALEHFEKCLTLSEASGKKADVINALNNIGLVHHEQGNYAQALEHFQKSLAMSEAIGDKLGIAIALNNIGRVHRIQGNYALALESYQKSLALGQLLGNKAGIALVHHNIGNVYRLQGNFALASESFEKSLAIREAIGNKTGIASTLNNLGLLHRLHGDYDRALEHFGRSLALSEAMGNRAGIATALESLGRVRISQGNDLQALADYQKSLAIREAIGDKAGLSDTLNDIGEVYQKQGQYSQLLDSASRAAALARQIGHVEALWRARLAAGNAYRALGQPDRASQAFEEAIAVVEELRTNVAGGEQEQQRFFESRVLPYQAMVDLLIHEARPIDALTFAERAKARVLLDVLQTGRVNVTKTMTVEEREQERTLNAQLVTLNTQISREEARAQPDRPRLAALESQLDKVRLDLGAFQTNLYAAHPELRVVRGEAQPFRFDEAAALLPDAESALLEYVVTDPVTYLFVVTRAPGKTAAELQVFTLPVKRAELAKQTESFRGQLAGRDLDFRASARRLYQLLLEPARNLLRGKAMLVVVPDDQLWELSFQALIDGDDRYVIERSAVAYAPSLTVLREIRARWNQRGVDPAHSTLLALGNPALGKQTVERATLTLRGEKLAPLPEAEREVLALGKLYGATRSRIYVGPEAREDRFKAEAGGAGILHFATHGVLNNASPMYSHLMLAQGDGNEDGLLEAWELMQLDLKADLAVLSGCETARGRFGAGEGMIGLTWAMFVAGVPTTVVSQWQVESGSTRNLMTSFHRALGWSRAGREQRTKSDALRQAALTILRNPETSHPFYWAGFVLVGDGR